MWRKRGDLRGDGVAEEGRDVVAARGWRAGGVGERGARRWYGLGVGLGVGKAT